MAEYTTRISDLPENITVQMPTSGGMGGGGGDQNINYLPMNVHPNPYGNGNGPQNIVMPNPQQGQMPEQQFRLPSRDIPLHHNQYTHDEEIQANYIPKPKLLSDYIENHDEMNDKKIKQHEKTKKRMKLSENIWNESQIPIFIAILFFIFQMPILNTLVFKNFSFLSLYNSDGNINFNGLLIKSIIFGLSYYSLGKLLDILSEL